MLHDPLFQLGTSDLAADEPPMIPDSEELEPMGQSADLGPRGQSEELESSGESEDSLSNYEREDSLEQDSHSDATVSYSSDEERDPEDDYQASLVRHFARTDETDRQSTSEISFVSENIARMTPETEQTLRFWSVWVRGSATVSQYNLFRDSFIWPGNPGPVPRTLHAATQLARSVTGLETRHVDMCVNSCMAFTGKHANLQHCCARRDGRVCGKSRYDEQGCPRRRFAWIPVLPRLKVDYQKGLMPSYFRDAVNRARETADSDDKVLRDFADGSLCAEYEEAEATPGTEREYLLLSIDGAQWREGKPSDGWLILATRLCLPPETRYKESNTVLIALVPGPNTPCDLNSFLQPIVEEITTTTVSTFDLRTGLHIELQGRIVGLCADQPGSAKVSKMTGTAGHSGCRFCAMTAAFTPGYKPYFPLSTPGHVDDRFNSGRTRAYDPYNLPLRSHSEYMTNAERVGSAKSPFVRASMRKKFGIGGKNVFHDLSTFRMPYFFPLDVFHLTGLNMPQLLMKALTNPDSDDTYHCLPPLVYEEFGRSIAEHSNGLPVSFSSGSPRDPFLYSSNSAYRAWEWMLVVYTYLGMFLCSRDAPQDLQSMLHSLRTGVKMVLGDGMTKADAKSMHRHFVYFAQTWERIFVRGDPARLHHAT